MRVTSLRLTTKVLIGVSVAGVLFTLYVWLGLSVDQTLTEDDKIAIQTLKLDGECEGVVGEFSKEISCVSEIQKRVQSIGGTECAAKGDNIEPLSFLERGYGCCFDRARFIEKTARYYGFETRHIFLIVPYKGYSVLNFLPLGQASHATSEIMTSKGWMGVDSNEPFILLREGDFLPRTYEFALSSKQFSDVMEPKKFFKKDFDVIVGLYSRHGFFHGKNFPGPELSFSEFIQNFEITLGAFL